MDNKKIELFKRLLINNDMSVYDELFPDAKEGDKEECAKFLERINDLTTIEGLWWWCFKFIISNIGCGWKPIDTKLSKDQEFIDTLIAATKGNRLSAEKLNEYLDAKRAEQQEAEKLATTFSECCAKALANQYKQTK